MRVFNLDGGTHAVKPEDIAFFTAPHYLYCDCSWGASFEMYEGETVTLYFDAMKPGELVTVFTVNRTRFFRPEEEASQCERKIGLPSLFGY